jgi:hypothetical protein
MTDLDTYHCHVSFQLLSSLSDAILTSLSIVWKRIGKNNHLGNHSRKTTM